MAFDGITVAAVVQELEHTLVGGRISKIAQPENDELLLTIKGNSGQKRLYISASASLPLIYLTNENKPSPMTAPGFCMLLRKHIGGGQAAAGVPGFGTVGGFNHAHTHLAGCDLQLQTFFLCHITHQTPCSSLP